MVRTKHNDIILEFISQGRYVKVVAIDSTGREVSIVGDAKASKAKLTKVAVAKLHYVQKKEAQKSEDLC